MEFLILAVWIQPGDTITVNGSINVEGTWVEGQGNFMTVTSVPGEIITANNNFVFYMPDGVDCEEVIDPEPCDTIFITLPPDTVIFYQVDTVITQEYVYITDTLIEYVDVYVVDTLIEYITDTVYIYITEFDLDTIYVDNILIIYDTVYIDVIVDNYIFITDTLTIVETQLYKYKQYP